MKFRMMEIYSGIRRERGGGRNWNEHFHTPIYGEFRTWSKRHRVKRWKRIKRRKFGDKKKYPLLVTSRNVTFSTHDVHKIVWLINLFILEFLNKLGQTTKSDIGSVELFQTGCKQIVGLTLKKKRFDICSRKCFVGLDSAMQITR